MTEAREELRSKLKDKLRELFQFDVSDLDFGIYRILNRKRDEIEEFIEQDLLNAIEEGLKEYQKGDRDKFEAQLKDAKSKIPDKAFDESSNIKEEFEGFEDVEQYKEAKYALESLSVSEEIEKRIYQDLYTFFSRYYDDGDFLTQRRISTRDSKYAIPYNGEEVKLHWANKDQYYIKTGEHFANYKFEANGLDVWFKVQEAEVEKDNVKESDTRYFVLRQQDPIETDEENDTLTLWFEYKVPTDEETNRWLEVYNSVEKSRKTMDRQTFCTAFNEYVRSNVTGRWRDALSTMPDNKEYSLLYDKLNHFTAKNTTDYFIHKNLQEFLERELEYYLKHEVIQVDDFIKADSEQPLQTALTRAKVVRGIAEKVITFLSQIEDFQKKLFEKKKFVVDTHYCVTLDKVPEELYETILRNEEQLEYWEECYGMDQWEKNLEWNGEWTEAVLKSHSYMMIDTKFFEDGFKYELLGSFDDLEEESSCLLLNSENYQGINVLKNKYTNSIDGIYIDPPYNTKSSEILYKNSFKHSSWLSLLENRVVSSKDLMKNDALLTVTIDDYEVPRLWMLMNQVFGNKNHLGTAVIRINPGGRKSKRKLAAQHEYALFYALNGDTEVSKIAVDPEDKSHTYVQDEEGNWYEERNLRKEGKDSFGDEDSNRYFPIYYDPDTGRISSKEELKVEILPLDTNDQKRIWRRGYEDIDSLYEQGDIFYKETSYGPQIYFRFKGGADEETPKSLWTDAKYSASEHGTQNLLDMMGEEVFSFPKSPHAVEECLRVLSSNKNALFLDYFAGSGTTGEAVMSLNRRDDGDRKCILIEMGQYFHKATIPRLLKYSFSDEWNNGVPQNKNGQSNLIKYHFIESYEDALNNIDFKDEDDVQQAMEFDDYMLKYMLDFETKGVSATLLKEEAFETPFDYELKIKRGHESPALEKVDMVETFHYLIGLWVQTLRRYEHQDKTYIISKGEIRDKNAIEEVLVIWRNTKRLELEKEAEWVREEIIKDQTFDRIYVNGVSKVKGAEPTDITFREKMFEEVA